MEIVVTILASVILLLLGGLGWMVKSDILDVKKNYLRKDEVVPLDNYVRKEEMEKYQHVISNLLEASKKHVEDVKANYVRKETINGELRNIRHAIETQGEKYDLIFEHLYEKLDNLTETRNIKEQIREFTKTKEKYDD